MSGLSDEVREEWAEALCNDAPAVGGSDPDEWFRAFADALAPLIREAEARGAAAVVERVEAVADEWESDNDEHAASWGHNLPVSLGDMANHLRAALTQDEQP